MKMIILSLVLLVAGCHAQKPDHDAAVEIAKSRVEMAQAEVDKALSEVSDAEEDYNKQKNNLAISERIKVDLLRKTGETNHNLKMALLRLDVARSGVSYARTTGRLLK